MYLQIKLTPLDAFFLGGERNNDYGDSTPLSQRKPYFIRSEHMPSQSALLGVLRYLGIRSPEASFRLTPEDQANIGACSFQLTQQNQQFGRIRRLFPLMLTDETGKRYIPAPRWYLSDGKLFRDFSAVQTPEGERYLPTEYDEKKAPYEQFLCLGDGSLITDVFSTEVRVGINRIYQRKDETDDTPSGFFKKEYIRLRDGLSFLCYAEVEDDFFAHHSTVVYMGQGQTPFAAEMTPVDTVDLTLPTMLRSISLDGRETDICSAVALSDCYLESIESWKQRCMLMIAGSKIYRGFSTCYNATQQTGRYKKQACALHLVPAGSVFLFRDATQMAEFRAEIERNCNHPQKAGYQYIGYSE